MKNRSFTLLALLFANNRLGEPAVNRTTLVKQAFLAETIHPLYRVWVRAFGFFRYYFGPYSEDIFQCLDMLIFNGLVEVVTIEQRAGKIEARYQITTAGQQILGQFGQLEITNLAMDLVWALQSLGVEQAGTICKLVYQEAEFARIFAQHAEDGIGPEAKISLPAVTSANNETFSVLASLQELQFASGIQKSLLPPREIVRLFLLSLAREVPCIGNKINNAT